MYPLMQLGGEKEMIEQAQVGALQIARISVGAMGPVVDELNVFNLPFIFRDEAHMRKVIDGPIGQGLLDRRSNSIRRSRLIALGWMDAGTRNVYSNKPVTKPADLKGVKIRMMGNPIFVETMNAMGGNGVAMGFNELYSALQTGVVDGAENNEPTVLAQNHYRSQGVQPHRPPDHSRDLRVLQADLGRAVQGRSGSAASRSSRAKRRSSSGSCGTPTTAEADDELKAKGVQFVAADKAAFYKATQPIRDKYGAKYATLLKQIERHEVASTVGSRTCRNAGARAVALGNHA